MPLFLIVCFIFIYVFSHHTVGTGPVLKQYSEKTKCLGQGNNIVTPRAVSLELGAIRSLV